MFPDVWVCEGGWAGVVCCIREAMSLISVANKEKTWLWALAVLEQLKIGRN